MKDLLTLDFEGCLKYFRVSMPKKYRSEDASMELLHDAVHLKVSLIIPKPTFYKAVKLKTLIVAVFTCCYFRVLTRSAAVQILVVSTFL